MEIVTQIRPLEIDQSGQLFEVTLKGGLRGTYTLIVGEDEIEQYRQQADHKNILF